MYFPALLTRYYRQFYYPNFSHFTFQFQFKKILHVNIIEEKEKNGKNGNVVVVLLMHELPKTIE